MGNRARYIFAWQFLPFLSASLGYLHKVPALHRAPARKASQMANLPGALNPMRHRGHDFGGPAHHVAYKAGQLRRPGAAGLAGVAYFVIAHLGDDGA